MNTHNRIVEPRPELASEDGLLEGGADGDAQRSTERAEEVRDGCGFGDLVLRDWGKGARGNQFRRDSERGQKGRKRGKERTASDDGDERGDEVGRVSVEHQGREQIQP